MASGAAKISKLGALHELVATRLAADILRCVDAGEPVPSALYSQIIKFLKDNNISAEADLNPALSRLKDAVATNVLAFPFTPQAAEG